MIETPETIHGEPGDAPILPFTMMGPLLQRAWDLSCQGQIETATALAQRVHDEAAASNDEAQRALAACHLGWYCFMQAYYEEGILHVLSARDFFQSIGDKPREGWARAIHAWLLIEIGAPNEALDEAMLGLECAEHSREDRAISTCLNVVGVVYWMLGQLDRALQFAESAVAVARNVGDPVDLGRWLINLADIEAAIWKQQRDAGEAPDEARLDRALTLAAEALSLTSLTRDSWTGRIVLCSLADFHLLRGQRGEAARLLEDWDKLQGGSGARSRLYYLLALGRLRHAEGEHEAAIGALLSCATLAEETSDLEIGVPCCLLLSDCLAVRGEFEQALRWHREYHKRFLRRSTESSLARSRVAAIRYETRQLQARVEAERSRADGLEEMNRALAQQAALLMSASMEDVLTGLPNRRGLESALLAITLDGARSYSLAMIDLDHFKQINDRFTHLLGDEVLREVARALRIATNPEDLLFRYGGEEFVLLMLDGDELRSARTCLRVCQVVRNWNWARIHRELQVTLSIGLARSSEAPTPADVLSIADGRLYEAKNSGRDGMVLGRRPRLLRSLTLSPMLH
ncbi:GGDEF domain-containing protein [Acidisoma sp. 7E03]